MQAHFLLDGANGANGVNDRHIGQQRPLQPANGQQTSAQRLPVFDDIPIIMCTLGTFVMGDMFTRLGPDQHVPPDPDIIDSPVYIVALGVMGGAGTWAALGGRIVAGETNSKSVSWIVDCGTDFTRAMQDQITEWGTTTGYRPHGRQCTRGWYLSDPGEKRVFHYLTPEIPIDQNSLAERQLHSRSFHLTCAPGQCESLVRGILARRQELAVRTGNRRLIDERPFFVWELSPILGSHTELQTCLDAQHHVGVFCLNHIELVGLLNLPETMLKKDDGTFSRRRVEEWAEILIQEDIRSSAPGTIVVRCGKHGCLLLFNTMMDREGSASWFPAYHDPDCHNVVDTTGAGHCFVGAMTWSITKYGNCREGVITGMIAAGIAVEQVGMPTLSNGRWNGLTYQERYDIYKRRLDSFVAHP